MAARTSQPNGESSRSRFVLPPAIRTRSLNTAHARMRDLFTRHYRPTFSTPHHILHSYTASLKEIWQCFPTNQLLSTS